MSQQDPQKFKSSSKLGAKAIELTGKTETLEEKMLPQPTKVPPVKEKGSKMIFALFLLANLFINYDGGVVPASLVQIENELHISYTEEAALGSLVYVGLSAASLFVSPTFKKYQAKNILGFMLLMKAVSCGLFSYFSDIMLLYALRLIMGITQAFCVIYAPVWVNEFSPKEKSTTWMGILHAFVPIGIMLGFVFAAIVVNYFAGILTWRFAFQVQAVCELPIAILFFFQDNSKVDVLADTKDLSPSNPNTPTSRQVRMDSINYDEFKDVWQQTKMIILNKTLVLTSLSLCSLFYVVTGVQYWSSLYMIRILHISPKFAMMSFGVIAITAPLAGVFVGGITSDSLVFHFQLILLFNDHKGGYRGNNLLTAIKLCSAYSIVAFLISMPLNSVTNPWFFGPLLWVVLFFGACIIPTATGIIVDCVPREYQAINSSFSQLLYNIFGYFMAPVLSAIIMDRFDNEEEGLIWGFRSVLWFSIFGVVFMMMSWYIAARDAESYKEMTEQYEPSIHNLSKAEIKFEVARRRAVSFL